jgi:hypothetical protein
VACLEKEAHRNSIVYFAVSVNVTFAPPSAKRACAVTVTAPLVEGSLSVTDATPDALVFGYDPVVEAGIALTVGVLTVAEPTPLKRMRPGKKEWRSVEVLVLHCRSLPDCTAI